MNNKDIILKMQKSIFMVTQLREHPVAAALFKKAGLNVPPPEVMAAAEVADGFGYKTALTLLGGDVVLRRICFLFETPEEMLEKRSIILEQWSKDEGHEGDVEELIKRFPAHLTKTYEDECSLPEGSFSAKTKTVAGRNALALLTKYNLGPSFAMEIALAWEKAEAAVLCAKQH